MRSPLKVLYVASEVNPFAKTGHLADAAASLTKALQEQGHDIRVMMPKYGRINERKYTLREVIRLKNVTITIGDNEIEGSVKSAFLPESKVQVYFLEHVSYYCRKGYYADAATGRDFPDNAERFIYFCKGVLETCKLLHWQPHVIHCNDWQTSLLPLLLKTTYLHEELFKKTAALLSIHNFKTHLEPTKNVYKLLGFSDEIIKTLKGVETDGKIDFLKAGILYSDQLVVPSESYVEEAIKNKCIADELIVVLQKRKSRINGILSGVDDSAWNPCTDVHIQKQYSASSVDGKADNKKALVESYGLPYDERIPVLSVVAPCSELKDFEPLLDIIYDLLKLKVQFIFMGEADAKSRKSFEGIKKRFRDSVGLSFASDEPLTHQVIAGSDLLLAPFRYELESAYYMSGLVYGTIPIARVDGVGADFITRFDAEQGTGNGFIVDSHSSRELLRTIKNAVKLFADQKTWQKVVRNAMKSKFSWKVAASKYVRLYAKLEMAKRK